MTTCILCFGRKLFRKRKTCTLLFLFRYRACRKHGLSRTDKFTSFLDFSTLDVSVETNKVFLHLHHKRTETFKHLLHRIKPSPTHKHNEIDRIELEKNMSPQPRIGEIIPRHSIWCGPCADRPEEPKPSSRLPPQKTLP